ncbi:unnamed protein product [Protopolystoma xenopodis]|uniref:Uncharacterized protein n=1 Tax=Protopolystoma xenopodis TaxID=117903 RepID=A0A448WDY9_9PLAT|nr:unnamed protein product [Protopolystoma xenopodis]
MCGTLTDTSGTAASRYWTGDVPTCELIDSIRSVHGASTPGGAARLRQTSQQQQCLKAGRYSNSRPVSMLSELSVDASSLHSIFSSSGIGVGVTSRPGNVRFDNSSCEPAANLFLESAKNDKGVGKGGISSSSSLSSLSLAPRRTNEAKVTERRAKPANNPSRPFSTSATSNATSSLAPSFNHSADETASCRSAYLNRQGKVDRDILNQIAGFNSNGPLSRVPRRRATPTTAAHSGQTTASTPQNSLLNFSSSSSLSPISSKVAVVREMSAKAIASSPYPLKSATAAVSPIDPSSLAAQTSLGLTGSNLTLTGIDSEVSLLF